MWCVLEVYQGEVHDHACEGHDHGGEGHHHAGEGLTVQARSMVT